MNSLLHCEGLSKRFGGLQAVQQVGFSIARGEIYGLIGPNGAGKTSLFNLLTGIYVPDSGRCLFDGAALPLGAPHRIARCGLARTFQNIRLFGNLSVLENVMVGRHVRSQAGVWASLWRSRSMREEERSIREKALQLLDYVGLFPYADELARHLSYGDQRRLEIARALATEPTLLALDEPAAGMNPTESAALRGLLERIRADGTSLLLIEHDMRLVMGLCDRVLVLDRGAVIAEGVPSQVQRDARVIEAYLGAAPVMGQARA